MASTTLRRDLAAALLVTMIAAVGCGESKGRLQVTGTVKHPDGSVPQGPASGYVDFTPEDMSAPNARAATGAINKETGEFTLYTEKPGDGAAPGKYKVTLRINSIYPPKPEGASSVVPLEYLKVETTPLSAEVDAAHTNFPFEVPKRGPASKKKK